MPPIDPSSHVYLRLSLPLIVLVVLWTTAPAGAVERSCGADPVENTANVLCAAPSGPCTDALVVVSAHITVRNGGCDFDLGNRALRIERTIRVPGHETNGLEGRMTFNAVADVTITRRAKLKARGDFVRPSGKIIQGGLISFEASGRIDVFGTLDSSGAGDGGIFLQGDEGVMFAVRSKTRARGISSAGDEDEAGGGNIEVESQRAGVLVAGEIDARGGNLSYGGTVEIGAADDVEVDATVDASSGVGEGAISVFSSDDVRIEGSLSVASRSGGGTGGDIIIAAGDSLFAQPEGVRLRGELHMGAARIDVRGSGKLENDPGSGGSVELFGAGAVRIGAEAVIRADSGSPLPDSSGGNVAITAGDSEPGAPADADIELAGTVFAHGNGYGGDVGVDASRDATLTGTVDVTGGDYGGSLTAAGGRNVTLGGRVRAAGTHVDATAGQIRGFAGERVDGTLAITTDLRAPAGAGGECSRIRMSTCTLSVSPGVTLDASCAEIPLSSDSKVITLLARNAINLGGDSRYVAASAGRVALVHPPGVVPTIGAGVEFIPTVVEGDDAETSYPGCGVVEAAASAAETDR